MAEGEITNSTNSSTFNQEVLAQPKEAADLSASAFSTIEYKKLEFTHAETEKEQDYKQEKDLLEKKLGLMGRLFGYDSHSSKHITFAIILILLILNIYLTYKFYDQPNCSEFVSKLWEQMFPLITLSLGYIFGREK